MAFPVDLHILACVKFAYTQTDILRSATLTVQCSHSHCHVTLTQAKPLSVHQVFRSGGPGGRGGGGGGGVILRQTTQFASCIGFRDRIVSSFSMCF